MRITVQNPSTDAVIKTINVKRAFDDTFYHEEVHTIGSKTCCEILNKMYPHIKADGVLVKMTDNKTNFTWLQKIYRKGTVITN